MHPTQPPSGDQQSASPAMARDAKIFIAGAAGMVGSAIVRRLLALGYSQLLGSCHSRRPVPAAFLTGREDGPMPEALRLVRLDLTRQEAVERFLVDEKPQYVFMAAARVGGIYANNRYPGQFIYENLAIQNHVIHAARQIGVERLLFLGSSCIYPKHAPQPMQEQHLLTGLLEPTNAPYAIAKIAGISLCESYNRQYGTRFVALMPTNLYGANDNFDLQNAHVLPALMRRFHEARAAKKEAVVVWGTGSPRREFLHVDDAADAAVFVMNLDQPTLAAELLSYPKPCFLNVGSGGDCSIRELAQLIKAVVGFEGEIVFDPSKPDGTPRKLLDVSRLRQLGWQAGIELKAGVGQTYDWFQRTLGR